LLSKPTRGTKAKQPLVIHCHAADKHYGHMAAWHTASLRQTPACIQPVINAGDDRPE
jgi:hypothetical protein